MATSCRADTRLAEIHEDGQEHLVSRSIQRATPIILRAVEQVHDRAARTTVAPRVSYPRQSESSTRIRVWFMLMGQVANRLSPHLSHGARMLHSGCVRGGSIGWTRAG